jgi:hypothetical protein
MLVRRIAFEAMSTKRLVSVGFIADASCVSRSTQIGSSSKNLDVAAEPIVANATAPRTTAAAAVCFIERRVIVGILILIAARSAG